MTGENEEKLKGGQGYSSWRGSEWVALRRSLAILRRLLQGPATGEDLIEAVRQAVGPEAYPAQKRARQEAFKRDRENLRDKLEASFHYEAQTGCYTLDDPGLCGSLTLPESELLALRLLSETFASEMGEQAEVQSLLERLVARLPPEDRLRLESISLPVDLDVFQGIDAATISPRVWETANRAARERRKLAFNYISPMQADQLPRYHEVAPYRVRFRRGHWYLYAYDLYWRNPYGAEWRDSGHRNFRLGYFVNDERLAILPGVLPPGQRRPPRYRVQYVLKPAVGRGAISRYFDEMQVKRLPDGSAEVSGFTDNDWEAVRILLGYGENCVVLGGEEVLRLMERHARGMAQNYGLGNSEN